ncbi:MAG TPA: cytochrome P450 [Streptosporangiaceae bacterium]|nr:cytochrome P450 [Streptosporangiaceae bacterium]
MPSEPPGPRLPALLQTALFLRDPLGTLEANFRRYGPVFRMNFVGFPPEVLVATAELAEKVYALDAGGGRAGEVRRQFLEPVVGRYSLLSLDGDPWWRHRKLLSPPLHGKAISAYRGEIAAIAAAQIDRWPVGTPFALRDRMQDITLEVILRLVFGVRDPARLARLRALVPGLADVSGPVVLLVMPPKLRAWAERSPVLRRLPFLPTTRFLRVRAEVDELLYEEIAQRRLTLNPDATDVLSCLLAARDEDGQPLSDQELRDELITLLEAGHETTATGLAWAFERLLRNTDVLSRLQDELAGGRDEYLAEVVKEALRSRPVVYDVPRLLDDPLRLGGFEVPAGWIAAPLIFLIHRDPQAFPEPEEFRPERFHGDESATISKSWMPFGGGRRYCAGAQLALLEMRVVITEVLRRVELAAPSTAPEAPRIKHVTVVPADKTRVVVRARKPLPAPAGRDVG